MIESIKHSNNIPPHQLKAATLNHTICSHRILSAGYDGVVFSAHVCLSFIFLQLQLKSFQTRVALMIAVVLEQHIASVLEEHISSGL